LAAWGVIALLIAVFPTHVYMYQNPKARMGLPLWALILGCHYNTTYVLGYQYTLLY
jgi:uncharacterized membrane protein